MDLNYYLKDFKENFNLNNNDFINRMFLQPFNLSLFYLYYKLFNFVLIISHFSFYWIFKLNNFKDY